MVIDLMPDDGVIEGDENAILAMAMRQARNALLAASDWTQAVDDPTGNAQAWAQYRQALRDFPATWEPAPTVEFPDPPAVGV